jgi:hypothetical protein
MAWVALVSWIATAAGGLVLATQWFRHGGPKEERGIGKSRLGGHAALAVGGLVLWLIYTLGGDDIFAWLALAVLGGVITLGLWMFVIWLRGHSPRSNRTDLPPETAFPVPLVLGHGVLGATTFVLALVAALL